MTIFTIGFTQKTAKEFFELLKKNKIELLVDVRLNNQSQLAGFTKGQDLSYFLKEIVGCEYSHDLILAPTKELLNDYKKGTVTWDRYVEVFSKLIESRKMAENFEKKYSAYSNVVLLCSEPKADKCHRRLVAEAVSKKYGYEIKHL